MRTVTHVTFIFLAAGAAAGGCFAQDVAILKTSDTAIELRADGSVPTMVAVSDTNRNRWVNRSAEALIPFVESAGKRTAIQWIQNRSASRALSSRIDFVYESQTPHLRLTWTWLAREPFGPIEHEIVIENLDSQEFWIPLQDSFRFDFRVSPDEPLEHFFVEKGESAPSNTGAHRERVTNGYTWAGESSTYASPAPGEAREIIPWMLLEQPREPNAGLYVGIEFSGRTRLTLSRNGDSVGGVVGLNPSPGPFLTRLAPGEVFLTPTIFLGAFSGGVDAAGNLLRRWERTALLSPRTLSDPSYPLLVNNSWGSGMAVDESLALRMIRESAELGLEMFHMDAGWFRSPGDWQPDPKKFPYGLAPVADAAHRAGLKFGLWADWSQAGLGESPGALNVRDPKVRDWLVNDLPADWKPEEFKGQTIDIGVPAARLWAEAETKRIVEEYKLDMLEHDGYLVAKGCDRSDHPHAPAHPANTVVQSLSPWTWTKSSNSTDVSYHATNAYYSIQDKLRREHPGILLEVCNDGGRMVDFGSAAHADYFSIADAYDPLSNRRAFFDASHVFPPAMLETYVEKWRAPRLENFLYMLRSGMMGWLTVMQDTSAWTPEQHAAAKSEFEFYKRELRPLIRAADLYHLSPRPDGVHWDAIEYFDASRGHGALYVFRGSSPDRSIKAFPLRGLNSRAKYKLSFRDDASQNAVLTGRQLAAALKIRLAVPLSSEVVLLEQVP